MTQKDWDSIVEIGTKINCYNSLMYSLFYDYWFTKGSQELFGSKRSMILHASLLYDYCDKSNPLINRLQIATFLFWSNKLDEFVDGDIVTHEDVSFKFIIDHLNSTIDFSPIFSLVGSEASLGESEIHDNVIIADHRSYFYVWKDGETRFPIDKNFRSKFKRSQEFKKLSDEIEEIKRPLKGVHIFGE